MSELLSLKEDPRRRCKWTQNAGNMQMFLFCWLHLININECNRFSASNLNFLGPSHVDWMFPGDKENRHINGNIYTSAAHTDLVRVKYTGWRTKWQCWWPWCLNFQLLWMYSLFHSYLSDLWIVLNLFCLGSPLKEINGFFFYCNYYCFFAWFTVTITEVCIDGYNLFHTIMPSEHR